MLKNINFNKIKLFLYWSDFFKITKLCLENYL